MTYPHVTQFETRAQEAEALARLAQERRALRTQQPPTDGSPRLLKWRHVARAAAACSQ
jgi:hypothetical protein